MDRTGSYKKWQARREIKVDFGFLQKACLSGKGFTSWSLVKAICHTESHPVVQQKVELSHRSFICIYTTWKIDSQPASHSHVLKIWAPCPFATLGSCAIGMQYPSYLSCTHSLQFINEVPAIIKLQDSCLCPQFHMHVASQEDTAPILTSCKHVRRENLVYLHKPNQIHFRVQTVTCVLDSHQNTGAGDIP